MAYELEKRFNLNLIDVDKLIKEELDKDSEMGHALRTQKTAGVEQYDDIDVVTILTD